MCIVAVISSTHEGHLITCSHAAGIGLGSFAEVVNTFCICFHCIVTENKSEIVCGISGISKVAQRS